MRRQYFNTCLLILGFVFVNLLLTLDSLWSDERSIVFPVASPVGVISCSPPPTYDGAFIQFSYTPQSVQRAVGQVSVPEESFVELELTGRACPDLKFLDSLPPDAIHALKVLDASMSRQHLLSIAKLQALVRLEFRNCDFTQDAFSNVPSLPRLAELQLFNSRKFETEAFGKWLKDQDTLESLFVLPGLKASTLKALDNHASLTMVNVSLENDFPDSISALSKLPKLRGLNLQVPEDADNDLWIGGTVDTPTLVEFSELPNLKRLDLGQIKTETGFCNGIALLTQLEHLSIVERKSSAELAPLVHSLLQLPKLKRWPRIDKIDADSLQAICNLEHIESLSLSEISKIPMEQLKNLGKLKNLRTLDLEHVNVDDEWLACLGDLNQLESLTLFVTSVTGPGFESLSDCKSINKLHIFNQQRQFNLEPVAALPHLEQLHFGGFYDNQMLAPLGKSQSLKKLILDYFGKPDDVTTAWIGDCPNMVELNLEGKFTDMSAASLANLPGIQSIRLSGGSMTKTGILKLASIPSLRTLSVDTTSEIDAEAIEDVRKQVPWLPWISIRQQPSK